MGLCVRAPDLVNPAFGLLANSPTILYCLKWRLFLRFQNLLFPATRNIERYLIDLPGFGLAGPSESSVYERRTSSKNKNNDKPTFSFIIYGLILLFVS